MLGMAFYNNLDTEASGTYRINVGPGGSIFGLGLGGFIKGHIGVGCRVTASIGTLVGAEVDDSRLNFEYQILPYFEYVFGRSKVRPFIQVDMGLGGYVDRYEAEDNSYKNVETELMYLFGFGGGAHFFFGERASFDLWLIDMVGIGKYKSREESFSSSSYSSDYYEPSESESSILTNDLALFIGVAIWI